MDMEFAKIAEILEYGMCGSGLFDGYCETLWNMVDVETLDTIEAFHQEILASVQFLNEHSIKFIAEPLNITLWEKDMAEVREHFAKV